MADACAGRAQEFAATTKVLMVCRSFPRYELLLAAARPEVAPVSWLFGVGADGKQDDAAEMAALDAEMMTVVGRGRT